MQPIRCAAQVFATGALGEVRVWHITTCRELLRVRVPNLACRCLAFSADGSAILSGWDDGSVRAFGPQTGKALWTVAAHHMAVTALAGCLDGGRFRVGRRGRHGPRLAGALACTIVQSIDA